MPTLIRFRPPPGFGFGDLPLGAVVQPDGDALIASQKPTADLHQLTSWALDHGVELESLTVSRPSLEDIYLTLIDEEST